MQIARAAGLRATRGFAAEATGTAYEEARVLATAAGDSNALITTLNGLYAYHLVRAEHAQARPVAEELLRLATQLGDATHQMLAHRALGAVLFHTGSADAGRSHLEQSLAAYDPEKHARLATLLGTDHAETAMSFLSLALWVLGRPDQALRMQLGALAHAERLGHLHSIAQALTYLCFVRLLRREPAAAEESAVRLVALADEHSFPLMAATGRFWAAWALSKRGDLPLGIERMEQAAADWWATGAQTYRSFAETVMAEARLAVGDLDAAGLLLQAASARVAASDERWAEPELMRIRGELERARGDEEAALGLFHAAIDRAATLGAPMWRCRAAASLARCLMATGRTAEARDALAPLLDEMPEGPDTQDVTEVKDILRSAGSAPSAL
jgi:predicted ATPase